MAELKETLEAMSSHHFGVRVRGGSDESQSAQTSGAGGFVQPIEHLGPSKSLA